MHKTGKGLMWDMDDLWSCLWVNQCVFIHFSCMSPVHGVVILSRWDEKNFTFVKNASLSQITYHFDGTNVIVAT